MATQAAVMTPPTARAHTLVRGAFDLHVHIAPDVPPRRIDDVSLARRFVESGLGGFGLKSHYTSTAERAQVVIDARRLPPGFVSIDDSRYLLRPEAIESVFVLYRITGDKTLQDRAWKMFTSINAAAKTDIAFASVNDVTAKEPELFDSMESFWTAETLKYFYLIFAEPDVVSLDDYVL